MTRIFQSGRIFFMVSIASSYVLGALGCGVTGPPAPKTKVVPVAGTMKIGGDVVESVEVMFTPWGDNKLGQVGMGMTDSNGEFDIISQFGRRGLPPGTYVVTASLIKPPDGTERPWDDKPAQSPEFQIIPTEWNNLAQAGRHNKVTVPDEGRTDFQIKIPRKP